MDSTFKACMKKALLLSAALLAPSALFSQSSIGYAFLRTPVGARPSAMAGSFVALTGDAHSIYYNPAGVAGIDSRTATFGYLNHVLDIQSLFGAYVLPRSKGTLGFAVQYTSYGEFKRMNEFGQEDGTFGASNMVAYLSYSQRRGKNFMLGANVKYIRSELEVFSSDAVAVDLGFIYQSPFFGNLDFGGGIFNAGGVINAFDVTKEELPLNLQIGASKRLQHLPLRYSLSLIKYLDDNFVLRAGGELNLATGLFLRLGYDSIGSDQKVGTDSDRFAGLSLGLGLEHQRYKIDYGISSFGEVGSLNRFSVGMKF